MIGRVSRRFQNNIRELQRSEPLGVDRDQSIHVPRINDWVPVVAMAKQCQHLAEQPRHPGRAAALEGVLAALQTLDGFGVEDDLRPCYLQHLVQETGVIVMCMRQEHIADFLWIDAVLPQLLYKARETARISGIDQDISVFIGNQVVIDHTVAKVENGHGSSLHGFN